MESLDTLSSAPVPHLALILEGGGQRGIFTAGILDAWLEHHYNPFSMLVGISAGAQNLTTYLAGQHGLARKIITELTKDKQFFKVSRSLFKRDVMDLDWYFEQSQKAGYRIDIDAAANASADRDVRFVATFSDGKTARFIKPQVANWFDVLKASSAIPGLYRDGVCIDDQCFMDGGVADPLPVEHTYQQGAKKMVIIRTTPPEYIGRPWLQSANRLLGKKSPEALKLLKRHEQQYESSLAFIESPPDDVEIVQLFPEAQITSHVLGSKRDQLDRDYYQGHMVGSQYLACQQHHFCQLEVKGKHSAAKARFSV